MTQKLQKRLGLKLKRYGSHVLRHACATHLLCKGLTLKQVGDHLAHVSVAATRIYAKVDLTALREVAALDLKLLVAVSSSVNKSLPSTASGKSERWGMSAIWGWEVSHEDDRCHRGVHPL
jgi:hypothetical protein